MKSWGGLLAVIALSGCGSVSDLAAKIGGATPTPTPTAPSIVGNWKTCYDLGNGSSNQFRFVITGTTFNYEQSSYSNSTCSAGGENTSTSILLDYTYDADAGNVDATTSKYWLTFWDPTKISELNDGDINNTYCGSTTWQIGVKQEVTNESCDQIGTTAPNQPMQFPVTIVDQNTVDFGGILLNRY